MIVRFRQIFPTFNKTKKTIYLELTCNFTDDIHIFIIYTYISYHNAIQTSEKNPHVTCRFSITALQKYPNREIVLLQGLGHEIDIKCITASGS